MMNAPRMGRDELAEFGPGEDAEAVPRERCFLCGYDLRGLPSGHACPECGPQVGLRAWRTTEGRVVWQRALAVMLIAILPPLFLGAERVISEASSWWTIAACIGAVAVLTVTVCAGLHRLSSPPARRDAELVLFSKGLTEHPRRGKPLHVPWSCFESVHLGRDLGGLRLLTLRCRYQGWLSTPAVCYIVDGQQVDADALRELIERLIADPRV